jgi:hypothetical protein
VVDRHEPQARAREGRWAVQDLTVEIEKRLEPAVIEQLGGEGADIRMQAMRLVEKQAAFRAVWSHSRPGDAPAPEEVAV